MHEQSLVARRRRGRRTTDSRHGLPVEPNRLLRDFSAPDRVWAGDITYLPTCHGFMYLAVLLDLFSRNVVGFSVGRDLERGLPLEVLRQALRTRRVVPGLMHHSDLGSQYASGDYHQEFRGRGVLRSMSRKGDVTIMPSASASSAL